MAAQTRLKLTAQYQACFSHETDHFIFPLLDGQGEANKAYNEDDWMEPEVLNAYGKSKTMAEKAAWEYVKELPGIIKQVQTFKKTWLIVTNLVLLFAITI